MSFTARFPIMWLLAASISLSTLSPAAAGWKSGCAKRAITPQSLMWMSGYASRDRPAEGTLHDLWAKAIVLEDAAGNRVALVTLDLVGIDRELSLAIRGAIESKYGLARQQIAICCSHTHTGPVVGDGLRAMYFLDDDQQARVIEYTARLKDIVVAVVGPAIADLAPAQLSWATGRTTFAVNRRNNPERDVSKLRAAGQLRGPVDHDVPVLAVRDPSGTVRSVVFGYACHATVLDFYQWSGDYPGFAQLALEAAHPGAVALFWAGCGADQNPLPRREVAHAESYGRRLAAAVDDVLGAPMKPIEGQLVAQYEEIDLPFDQLPTREQLVQDAAAENRYVASRAKLLLAQIDSGKPLSPTYPYPVQSWRLGKELLFVLLGGEVVVDYAIRIKHDLGRDTTWVAGYANDVKAYIPSRRVLAEGGYEGGGAMVYYGLPTVWSTEVEERIVQQVNGLGNLLRAAKR